jgi:hypothetical protein
VWLVVIFGEEMRAALVIKQHQDLQSLLYHRAMAALPIDVDRARVGAQVDWVFEY